MKKICLLLIVIMIVIVSVFSSCGVKNSNNSVSDIKEIYYDELSNKTSGCPYKISLEDMKIYGTYIEPFDKPYQLKNEKLDEFKLRLENSNFLNWETYENINKNDGYKWEIKVVFKDGEKRTFQGQNAFPSDWAEVKYAITNFTTFDIPKQGVATLHPEMLKLQTEISNIDSYKNTLNKLKELKGEPTEEGDSYTWNTPYGKLIINKKYGVGLSTTPYITYLKLF